MTPKRVLIVGGGFAGMYAAMEMRRLADAGHRVTLVSAENFMQYQPFLPEVASGTIDPRADRGAAPPVADAGHDRGGRGHVDRPRCATRRRADPRRRGRAVGVRRARGDRRFVVAGAPHPRAGGARDRVQDRAGGHLPAEPRALAAGRRHPDGGSGAASRRADVRVRGRRVRRGGGPGRARGPRPRRDAQLPEAGSGRDAMGAGRGGRADPARAPGGSRDLRAGPLGGTPHRRPAEHASGVRRGRDDPACRTGRRSRRTRWSGRRG